MELANMLSSLPLFVVVPVLLVGLVLFVAAVVGGAATHAFSPPERDYNDRV